MKRVGTERIMTREKNDHAGADAKREAQNVDKGKGLLPGDVSQGEPEMGL
jgi:hypothetical protein